MKQTTLWVILERDKILLCMKKRGFWEGLWNWAWWKLEEWETIEQAMIRELEEETLLVAKEQDLESYWVLHFYFEKDESFNQDINLFLIKHTSWEAKQTDEMLPKWFNIDKIPYDSMWEDDIIWLPRVLAWEKVEYNFYFWKDWKIDRYEKIK